MVRVDIEEIFSRHLRAVRVDARVVVHRHVEVLAQPRQRRSRHLHIQIPIPRHDLPVPPPA